MTQLLVQADDLAISHATTLGIIDSIRHGIVRNTGLFTNCPDAVFAASRLREMDGVDVGIDLNMVTGRPLLSPAEVPSLVNADGRLRASGQIRREYVETSVDGYFSTFETEPFDHDETLAEARAQFRRFFDLMGRAPAYSHHHSLISPMLDQVLHEVSTEFGVFVMDDLYQSGRVPMVPNTWYGRPFGPAEQASADPVAAFSDLLPTVLDSELSLLITHPGYVDAELLDISSYSIIRARDTQLMTDPGVIRALTDAGVDLVTYTTATLGGVPLLEVG